MSDNTPRHDSELHQLLEPVAAFYNDAIQRHGAVAEGVNWKSAEAQNFRFRYLTGVIDDKGKAGVSVADLGCGYGALYDYLIDEGFTISRYHGYDVAANMVTAAAARIGGNPGVVIRQAADLVDEVDYAFASGIFNVHLGQDERAWEELVLRTLDAMHAKTRRGFAFNLMTDKVDWRAPDLFYANAGKFLNICLDRYSRNCRLLHDMPLWEWTMHVRKS